MYGTNFRRNTNLILSDQAVKLKRDGSVDNKTNVCRVEQSLIKNNEMSLSMSTKRTNVKTRIVLSIKITLPHFDPYSIFV